jgi:hypothetical protein
MRSTPAGRQTGEPTVSHEGCSGFDSSLIYCIGGLPAPSGPAKPGHSPRRALPARRLHLWALRVACDCPPQAVGWWRSFDCPGTMEPGGSFTTGDRALPARRLHLAALRCRCDPRPQAVRWWSSTPPPPSKEPGGSFTTGDRALPARRLHLRALRSHCGPPPQAVSWRRSRGCPGAMEPVHSPLRGLPASGLRALPARPLHLGALRLTCGYRLQAGCGDGHRSWRGR